jgi:endonuclease-3
VPVYNNAIMQPSLIAQVIEGLKLEYGRPKWILRPDTIGVLVQTILSQNTSDTNSDKAFASLKKAFINWEAVARAPIDAIARSIQHGGLAQVKAGYIKDSLNAIKRRHGNLNLDFLKQMQIDRARDWLLQLPGIGLKTSNCVLLFSLGMPALPVDTHIHRISRRIGLIPDISAAQAHIELEKVVPVKEVYSFHILMIEHGRKRCSARKPDCAHCILSSICQSCGTFK